MIQLDVHSRDDHAGEDGDEPQTDERHGLVLRFHPATKRHVDPGQGKREEQGDQDPNDPFPRRPVQRDVEDRVQRRCHDVSSE